MNQRTTITRRLFNPDVPEVEGRVTFIMENSLILYVSIVLINRGDKCIMYDYSKCEPLTIDERTIPFRLRLLVSFVNPGEVHKHNIHNYNIFTQLTNLEYLEWKIEEKEREEAALPSVP